jgi:hypothetical protein
LPAFFIRGSRCLRPRPPSARLFTGVFSPQAIVGPTFMPGNPALTPDYLHHARSRAFSRFGFSHRKRPAACHGLARVSQPFLAEQHRAFQQDRLTYATPADDQGSRGGGQR